MVGVYISFVGAEHLPDDGSIEHLCKSVNIYQTAKGKA
jgi:hypothetical protein